jgi:hypothetical protein
MSQSQPFNNTHRQFRNFEVERFLGEILLIKIVYCEED